jgi:hypothetical protein
MRSRAQGILAFTAILAACLAGSLHLTWWTAVASACVLALISISNHALAARTLGTTGEDAVAILLASSMTNATVTALAAFAMGHGIGWLWGV